MAVPLLYGKKALGVLWVRGLEFGEVDQETVSNTLWRLAGEAALVLHAAQVTEYLESGNLDVTELLGLRAEDENVTTGCRNTATGDG